MRFTPITPPRWEVRLRWPCVWLDGLRSICWQPQGARDRRSGDRQLPFRGLMLQLANLATRYVAASLRGRSSLIWSSRWLWCRLSHPLPAALQQRAGDDRAARKWREQGRPGMNEPRKDGPADRIDLVVAEPTAHAATASAATPLGLLARRMAGQPLLRWFRWRAPGLWRCGRLGDQNTGRSVARAPAHRAGPPPRSSAIMFAMRRARACRLTR
jgi:hypothetical protein